MMRRTLTLPELGLIAGTRAMVGAGIGLLLADKIAPEKRRAVGWTLLSVGAISTIPLVAQVFFGSRSCEKARGKSAAPRAEAQTVGAGT